MPSSNDIQKLYIAYFNRPAEPAGMAYWQNSTMSIQQIAESFSQQKEYHIQYPNPSDVSGTINSLYNHMFGHNADAAGLNYWTNEVQTGRSTIANVAVNVLSGARDADLSTVNNKLAVANMFTQHVDTPAELNAYSSTYPMAFPIGRAFLGMVNAENSSRLQAEDNVDGILSSLVRAVAQTQGVSAPSTHHETTEVAHLVGVSHAPLEHSLLA